MKRWGVPELPPHPWQSTATVETTLLSSPHGTNTAKGKKKNEIPPFFVYCLLFVDRIHPKKFLKIPKSPEHPKTRVLKYGEEVAQGGPVGLMTTEERVFHF